ncbi:HAD family hydrolase [Aliarcobacter trophiarum LMG 25534]|uniref:phosphoglycolate phosphatase n=1 Tax=Aliarcobacter trophiarum LMG 25534 TaxID=1032241 RepID=A0AAD0QJE7_9BACT|nr:HAD family hydrolase [Aliarcobacter trophiarum]AXK48806.1 phosphoglycolate phosphatase-like HAD superfamily hydrolase [Aliarcobacter trophiarum LMG 25534]RXI25015.1 HAD family hydrolase [Aliarcobacter trophiarum]RXJ92126.1 HAD family hydrolase [Aliarcobacter trophiarum LMG 25534]
MKMIIFDMDGTLLDSGLAIANTVNYVRENLGLESLEKAYILENINDININSAEFFYNSSTFTPKITSLFEDFYSKNCLVDLSLYDGVKELLDDLKGDFKFSIATNANSNYAKKMLNHLEISKYFSSILGYNDVEKPKPNPDMVNRILDIHNIKKENAKVVGDSIKDTKAAFNAGVDGVLVNWGFSNYKNNALNSFDELRESINLKFNL